MGQLLISLTVYEKNMTENQSKFLRLSVIKGKTYDEIEQILGIERKIFSPWWNEFKDEREQLALIRDKWKLKCPEIDFEIFENWYLRAERKCFYCDITEVEISELWKKWPELTKRNRGRNLEIERLEPNKEYSETQNLVFSCYWCNNAKTDTFTQYEFKEIGKIIKNIWKERLK